MIEKALVYEIGNIEGLKGEIYPLNAPEGVVKPHIVYARLSTDRAKTLDGEDKESEMRFMLSIMTKTYGEMKSYQTKIVDKLQSFLFEIIGDVPNKFYIQDISIENVTEKIEENLKLYRGIIDFTIHGRGVL